MSMPFVIVPPAEIASPATLPFAPEPTAAQLLGPVAFFLAAAVAVFGIAWQLGWFRPARWSPPRCPTPASGARLWIGAAAIVFVSLCVPKLFVVGEMATTSRPATAPAMPTPAGDVVAMLVTSVVYLAIGVTALVIHATLGLAPALGAIGLRSDRARGRDGWVVLLGVPFAIALTMAVAALTQLLRTLVGFHQPSAHAMLLLMQRNEQSPWVLVLTIANATLLAPLAEELLFRGHLQTALTSLFPRRWPAIAITSVLFALMHEPWMIPPIFVLSLVIGYLYERTGNLWVAIATHVAFNATSTALFLASRGAM